MRTPGGLIGTLRAQPASVWALVAGTAVNKAGDFLQLFIVLMLVGRGDSVALIGVVLACYGAGELFGVAVAGPMTDRYGARAVVVASMAVNAVAVAAVPVASSVWLCVACGVSGAAANAYRPAASALLAIIVPADQRVPVFALQRMALNVGASVGPLLGGVLALASYPALFFVDAATSVVFAVVAARFLPRPVRREPGPAPTEHGRRAWLSWFSWRTWLSSVPHDRHFALFCGAMFLNALVYIQYLAALPLLLLRAELPATVLGLLVMINTVIVLAIELPLSGVAMRLSPRLVIVIGIVLVGAGEAMYGLAGGLAAFVLATLVWTLGEAFSTPMQSAYAVNVAALGREGSYASAASAAATVGYAVGPVAAVLVLGALGPTGWMFAIIAVTAVAAMMAAAGTTRRGAVAEPVAGEPVASGAGGPPPAFSIPGEPGRS